MQRGMGLVALFLAGCGPAPYTIGPEEPPTVCVTPAAVEVAGEEGPKPARPEPEDRWIPNGLPRPNPFEEHATWVGNYDCPQGTTHLALRILSVRGKRVNALFDFRHAPTQASGKFLLSGTFDEQTGDVALAPSTWLVRPDGYEWVGMVGHVSLDGIRFTGRIVHPDCGGFSLGAAQ
jgi:hypothetical protein